MSTNPPGETCGAAASGAVRFDAVLAAELEQTDGRRRQRKLAHSPPSDAKANAGGDSAPASPLAAARGRQLVGLAFSGGGIRSATFNLGFLQGLAGLNLLRVFDYLSTVSGRGYVRGWLAAWVPL